MGMTRERKEEEVNAIRSRLDDSEVVIIAHNTGLTVAEMTAYRSQLREEGASFKVTKNSLTKRALEGTQFEELGDMFKGPTGIATSQDPVAAAKVTHKFAKEHDKRVILGGAMGKVILDKAGVEKLAALPSLDELRSKLVGLLQAPATKLAGLSAAPARDLACVVKAYADKGE